MTNPFRDQEKFMKACDQKTDAYAISQYKMYLNLIDEEHAELKQAVAEDDDVELLLIVRFNVAVFTQPAPFNEVKV